MTAAALALLCVAMAVMAAWLAPRGFDLASLDLLDARAASLAGRAVRNTCWHGRPRAGLAVGHHVQRPHLALAVGCAAVLLSMVVGVVPACWRRAMWADVDAVLMRLCDVVLSLSIDLIALLIDGLGRALLAAQGGGHGWPGLCGLDPVDRAQGSGRSTRGRCAQHPR